MEPSSPTPTPTPGGRKSTVKGFVGNTDESKPRGINILFRDGEIVAEGCRAAVITACLWRKWWRATPGWRGPSGKEGRGHESGGLPGSAPDVPSVCMAHCHGQTYPGLVSAMWVRTIQAVDGASEAAGGA